MELVSYWVVGFSGSRRLEQSDFVRAELRRALQNLQELAAGQLVAISSAAIGADLLFIQETASLGIPWLAVLPFPADAFFNEKDFPDASERRAARQRVDQAVDCEIVRIPRDAEEATNSTWRHGAFADAGFRCVDECDVFIAVLHGTNEPGKPGGTRGVIDYARARKRPLLLIDSATRTVKPENWPTRLHDSLTDELRSVVPPVLKAKDKSASATQSAVSLAAWRKAFGAAAQKHVPRNRWENTAVVILHALATIITALILLLLNPLNLGSQATNVAHANLLPESSYARHAVISGLEVMAFLFVLSGFGFLVWVLWKHPQTRGANCRLAAEIGRSLLAVWNIPGAAQRVWRSPPRKFAHFVHSLLLQHRLDPHRPRVASSSVMSEADIKKLGEDYAELRIGPQIKYYSERYPQARRLARALEISSVILSALALVSAAFLAFGHPGDAQRAIWGLAKLAAATAAPVVVSMLVIHEVKRREARYREMWDMLEEYQQRVRQAPSLSTLQDLVLDLEHLFISETYEWWILAKENVAA